MEKIKAKGEVTECLPGSKFKIVLETGREITGYLSGKMHMNHIRVLIGDRVEVELDPYHGKGTNRIIKRLP